MWDSPPLPLNSYNILLRLTDFDNLSKEAVNNLFETAGELKNKHWHWIFSVLLLTQFTSI